jgi:hypothetical protein
MTAECITDRPPSNAAVTTVARPGESAYDPAPMTRSIG